jgi:hypothetical protein
LCKVTQQLVEVPGYTSNLLGSQSSSLCCPLRVADVVVEGLRIRGLALGSPFCMT